MTTYWITNRSEGLIVYAQPPDPKLGGFYGTGTLVCVAPTAHFAAVGLPHEIAPGECWEVRWEWMSVGYDYATDTMIKRIVPIARNVTAELKEKADG